MHDEMASMITPLLPLWLRLAWIIALGAIVVTHVGHAVAMPGQRRWWHLGHTAMAAGMALMYLLPRMQHPDLYPAGLVLFALVTLAEATATTVLRRREGVLNPLWMLATLDMLAMTYMLLPPPTRPTWLTTAVVLYLAAQALVWSLGGWDRLPVFRRGSPRRTPTATRVSPNAEPDSVQHPGPAPPTPLTTDPAPENATGPVVGLTAHSTVAVRLTLAVMTASMAYMLAVM